MRKKIAIITMPLGLNYGGIMQAFALQFILTSFGHEVLTIKKEHFKKNIILRTKNFLLRIFKKFFNYKNIILLRNKDNEQRSKETNKFIFKYIKISEPIDTKKKLLKHFKSNIYDAVIVGSDQIWRPDYSNDYDVNFFNFIDSKNTKKISYAASFGLDEIALSKDKIKYISNLLKDFTAISVREETGIKICHDIFGIGAELMADPTLLLSADEYTRLFNLNTNEHKNYFFSYILDNNLYKNNLIKKFSKLTNFKQILFEEVYKSNLTLPPVEKWLNAIKNSSYIITDSYHGVLFSLIFNKQFIVIKNVLRGSSRFETILNYLNLKDRMFEEPDNLNINLENKINYIDVNKKIEVLKNKSIKFLQQSLA